MGLKVAPALDEAAKARIYEFRYRIYVEELGIDTPEDYRAFVARQPAP